MPAHLDPDAAIMPGMTPSIPASINNLELIEYSKEMFGAFLDASMPIVNSREISNHTSVLLNLSVRRLVAAFIEPSNDALDSQIQVSIQKYFENKNSIVVPSTHNIQSLLFLSLFVEELGAGNKFTTAVRMACAMSWNRAFDQLDEDRNYGHGASYIWWSLVSLDTWLYVYSGVPPIIDYTGFNVPKPRRPPKFYRALIGLSEVLRMLVRPESIGEYAEFESALDALASWENSHRAEVYPPDSSDRFENIFDSLALLRILHSVVISLFILQDPLFAVKYSSLHTPEGSRQTSRADGDVIVSNSGTTTISTRDPLNVKEILATQCDIFQNGPPKRGAFKAMLKETIFTVDGPAWAFHRGLLRPQFTRNQITQLENLEEHASVLIQCIPEGISTDLQKLFLNFTMDSSTDFLFGESSDTLRYRLAQLQGQQPETEPWGSFYALHNPKELQDALSVCWGIMDPYIDEATAKFEQQKRGSGSASVSEKSKDKYIVLYELIKQTKDREYLRSSLTALILAGTGSVAGLLSFMFALLVQHPEVERKLRQAIYDQFGSEYENGNSRITFESLKRCTYLRWTIDETLRMYPLVPFDVRVASQDTTLPRGGGPDGQNPVFVPKGTYIEFCPYAMQRRQDIFGPDANWFRPERFETFSQTRGKGDNAWSYVPFSGGPRHCVGQQFALTEVAYVVVRFFQYFKRFESGEPSQFIKADMKMALGVGGDGVPVKCFKY
ncbi:Protein kinase alk2 [Drechslerella dactyloides]|uniref:Protein kinase alk2 n=1 Tax=Drechslerella dactyloides TaxID=74499 RepID=A0AAD6IZG6_DREDA|nr:Protein kinase alk2 [Drechslerella dactyloides]